HVDDDEDGDDDQEGGGDDQQEKIRYNSDIDGDDFDEFVHEEGDGFEMNWEKILSNTCLTQLWIFQMLNPNKTSQKETIQQNLFSFTVGGQQRKNVLKVLVRKPY
ncbi:hypothetical protein Tco_0094775, partial [Tanacetum coccineum]